MAKPKSSFSKKFKNLPQVLSEFQIQHRINVPFPVTEKTVASDYFKAELQLTFEKVPYNVSEIAVCETLIYPTLREVWKSYSDIFNIWSRALVQLDLHIKGYPDYLIARRSPLSNVIFDLPYVAVVEAKKEDFAGAWGQCLYEMHTIQQLNGDATFPVYGIASSGIIWQFGKLEGTVFTEYETLFFIRDTDILFSALTTLFEICTHNVGLFGSGLKHFGKQ
jgi:hypothetical protein